MNYKFFQSCYKVLLICY